jgi:hypothetical protein
VKKGNLYDINTPKSHPESIDWHYCCGKGQGSRPYFTDEKAADAAVSQSATQDALSVIGAWSDLDWDETVAALDRIRHESTPTPPIKL